MWCFNLLFCFLFLIFWKILHSVFYFTFTPTVQKGSFSSHLHQHLLSVYFILVILREVKSYLSGVLICISLVITDVEHFSYNYWWLVCVLWKNVASAYFLIKLFFCYWAICVFTQHGHIRYMICKYFLSFFQLLSENVFMLSSLFKGYFLQV